MRPLNLARFGRCHRKGHEWFPGFDPMEFLPTVDVCLRCQVSRTHLPWGQCLNGHPIAEHYPPEDPMVPVAVGDCAAPY